MRRVSLSPPPRPRWLRRPLALSRVTIQSRETPRQSSSARRVQTTDGRTLEGRVLNEGMADLQLRTDDQRIHLLRKAAGDRYRVVTSQRDWTTYHGDPGGNRYTTLTQIDKGNVARLAPRWVFPMPNVGTRSRPRPIVIDGIMYISSANEVYALDAGSGRQIWHYQRPRTKGLTATPPADSIAASPCPAIALFLLTDHAHMIAMNRFTGELLWDTEMADWRENYNGTSAPLVVGNLVISGTAGGDEGVRGFVAAYDTATGKEVWRFWTVPKPGEPGSETWQGKLTEHRGGAAWMTGTYDPQARSRVLADRQSRAGLQRRRAPGRQPLQRFRPRPRGEDRAGSGGTSSSRRTTSTTGTPRRRPCCSTPTGRASRASC